MKKQKPSYLNFSSKDYAWKPDVDYRKHPELYRVGKGEQGVLICEPYKSEIGKYWRFKNSEIAAESSEKIYSLFLEYLDNKDFVGADMARNTFRWVLQEHADILIIKVAGNMTVQTIMNL